MWKLVEEILDLKILGCVYRKPEREYLFVRQIPEEMIIGINEFKVSLIEPDYDM